MASPEYQPLAEIEVEAVRPERQGFTLTGQGPDHAQYQLDLQFDMPLDSRTRTVLGELLSHSGVTISRRILPARARSRAPETPSQRSNS